MSDFILKAGDTSPALTATLTDESNTPLDLSGAAVTFQMRPAIAPDDPLTVDAPATITDASGGGVRYEWQDGDTESPGRYYAEFDIEYTDGSTETVPNDDYFTILLTRPLEV